MKDLSVSIVITVLNEEKTIDSLLDSLLNQTMEPLEIIIVDGGSTDLTIRKIETKRQKTKSKIIRIMVKKGNRSVGRNYGVSQAKGKWIAFTDAGCKPNSNWLEELLKPIGQYPISNKQMPNVVAGYYYGLPKTRFQEAVVPYVLVMPDRVDPKNFLPATRSMLIKKSLFENMGGFDEKLSDNEDYEFANRCRMYPPAGGAGCRIIFSKDARVGWMPSKNLFEFTKMIFRFARGDAFAGLYRPKIIAIYLRYIIFLVASIYLLTSKCQISNYKCQVNFQFEILYLFVVWCLLFGIYAFWSIAKNKKYTPHSWFYLPLLQITSDLAVMSGNLIGLYKALASHFDRDVQS